MRLLWLLLLVSVSVTTINANVDTNTLDEYDLNNHRDSEKIKIELELVVPVKPPNVVLTVNDDNNNNFAATTVKVLLEISPQTNENTENNQSEEHCLEESDVKQWAVIVAGSCGWDNYRHQADACHAYHIFHNMGIPDEQIIVMMCDDIADNPSNPDPGVIINRRFGYNVYQGVPKDYTGDEVTPENFMNVLLGISTGGKKVLRSDSNDNVFVYFTDHGAYGLIAFPTEYLYADQLNDTLWNMYGNKMYGNLVFYLESCESGSMFDGYLEPEMNIWAVTASTPGESSYACEYVERLETYVGDCWSMVWLENSKKIRIHVETLNDQFELTKEKTTTSTACLYGDLEMNDMKVSEFMSSFNLDENTHVHTYVQSDTCDYGYPDMSTAMSSRNVSFDLAVRLNDLEKIKKEKDSRVLYEEMFRWCELELAFPDPNFKLTNVDMNIYRYHINKYTEYYGTFTDYGMKYFRCFAHKSLKEDIDESTTDNIVTN